MVFGPANAACALMTSTWRFAIDRARFAGISLIMSFSRSISAAQSSFGLPTAMWCTEARSISCSAWPAATNIFFGVQPRFGQVPPRSRASIMATDIPARRTGPVTPMPALPPPRMTTSNFSLIGLPLRSNAGRPRACRGLSEWLPAPKPSFRCDRGSDGFDHHGGHVELRDAIPDVVPPRDPFEIGPHRPDIAIVILGQEQPHRPVQPGIRVRGDELRAQRRVAEHQQG